MEAKRRWIAVAPPDFAIAFGIVHPPRAAQAHARLPRARCVVLESETGSGKTEAVLLWRFLDLVPRGDPVGQIHTLRVRYANAILTAGGGTRANGMECTIAPSAAAR